MHRILHKPWGIILSSAIGNINIAVTGEYVDVRLTAQGGIDILSERYFAYSGQVTVYDLAYLIEAEMRKTAATVARFTLSVFTDSPDNNADSCLLQVLYCDRFTVCTDIEGFLVENFLSTLAMRRVAPHSIFPVSFFARRGESTALNIHYTIRKIDNGGLLQRSVTKDAGQTATADGVVLTDIRLDDILQRGAMAVPISIHEIELVSFVVTCGQRSLTLFVDNALEDCSVFYFRNCFNVWEGVCIPHTTTAKTEVERSTAIINGESRFYDPSAIKSYEVETAPLTSDESEWIDQLFTSAEVYRVESGTLDPEMPQVLTPILITDSTCEIHNSDEKTNKVKFTWRYADNRPIIRLSASPGIFTSPYSLPFS